MTTLGIYGDSLADDYHWSDHHIKKPLTASAWTQLLSQHYRRCKNHAAAGSSLYYSYKRFLETHEKYDHVLFVATVPGRWPGELTVPGCARPLVCAHHDEIRELLADGYKFTPSQRDCVEALPSWFLHTRVDEYEHSMHKLMKEDVKRLRPDALVIDIIENKHSHGVTLNDIRMVMVKTMMPSLVRPGDSSKTIFENTRRQGWREREEHQICHMSPEVNRMVYLEMKRALDLGIWDPVVPEYCVHPHPWEHYFYRL